MNYENYSQLPYTSHNLDRLFECSFHALLYANKLPYNQPINVPSTNTVGTYTKAFLTPNTRAIANQFGKLSPGPVNSSAKAGPCPMPFSISVCTKGASVMVGEIADTTEQGSQKGDNKTIASQPFPDPHFGEEEAYDADNKNAD
jgi:hypothetical protein